MKRNILILTTPFRPNIGGVETHLDDLIEKGIKERYLFTVLTYQPLITEARGKMVEIGTNFRIYRIPWLRMNLFLTLEKHPILEFIYLFPPLFLVSLFVLLFNAKSVEVIHSQGLIAGTAGVILGKIFGKKNILSTHSIYNFPKSGLYFQFVKFLLKSSNKVLCLSYQSRREILELGVDQSKVEVFTYWVDQEIFKPIPKKKKKKEEKFTCLFVGRLVEGKGIPELLQAANLLKEHVKFIIIGDGPLADRIKDSENNLPNIDFKGKVDNAQLPKYYSSADVLIVPSTHEEGYGRVILEALSCGLPIIATNRGGVKEYVNDKIGVLIDVSPDNIKKAIISLLRDRKKLDSMRINASLYAKNHFNEKNSQIIFKNYE